MRAAARAAAEEAPNRRRAAWIVLGLVVATAIAYEPVRGNGFISFDDGVYLTENPHVREGLTADAAAWAFQAGYAGNWHPLTWLSHMADVSLWGLDPVPHHVTNVLLHAASAVVLFLLLRLLTRREWPSAFVAAVFALHPLHVESVAWAAERKDVLCTLLGLLALRAWVGWRLSGRRALYWLAFGLYALGLSAKPMLVSLPLMLALLELPRLLGDRSPGCRFVRVQPAGFARALAPFCALAAASAWVTVLAQRAGGAVTDVVSLSVIARLENAVTSCATYLFQAALPRGLAPFYPYPIGGIPGWKVLASCAAVGGLTVMALRRPRTHPWFTFGWLWYLVTLLPVIGIVQVGRQALADRYTYIPLVGVSVALAMELPARIGRKPALALAAGLIVVWIGLTRRQVALWQDDITLFGHALAVTERNYVAHDLRARALEELGRSEEALADYRAAISYVPEFAPRYNNAGLLLEALGRPDEALATYDMALARDPALAEAHGNRGNALDTLGRFEEAERAFLESLRLDPTAASFHNSYGVTLAKQGRLDEAIEAMRRAISRDPSLAAAYLNLARALHEAGRSSEAIEALHEGLRLDPGHAEARAALENLLRPEQLEPTPDTSQG
jgi:tetratricopeptide (TPR) repeat protein